MSRRSRKGDRTTGDGNCCDDGAPSIDNNVSERMLRPCAIGRKNWRFAGSGGAAAVHDTLLATAKANGVEPLAYARTCNETDRLFPRRSGL